MATQGTLVSKVTDYSDVYDHDDRFVLHCGCAMLSFTTEAYAWLY